MFRISRSFSHVKVIYSRSASQEQKGTSVHPVCVWSAFDWNAVLFYDFITNRFAGDLRSSASACELAQLNDIYSLSRKNETKLFFVISFIKSG